MYIKDPTDHFAEHDAKQQAWLDRLPKCSYCGEPIQGDYYFEINDEVICEECLNDNFRKWVDDFVQ